MGEISERQDVFMGGEKKSFILDEMPPSGSVRLRVNAGKIYYMVRIQQYKLLFALAHLTMNLLQVM